VGEEAVGMLDGMFSFVLVDLRDKSFIAARDPIGITPLYLGWGNDGICTLPSSSSLPIRQMHVYMLACIMTCRPAANKINFYSEVNGLLEF
jgi:asparagine synthetase B (glutamine-hydrolysing)